MPTTLADIVAQLKIEVNKGGYVERQIPFKLQEAISWFEQNYNFRYMRTFKRFTMLAGGLQPGPYSLVPNHKSIKFVRFLRSNVDGSVEYSYLHKCEPEDLAGVGSGPPSHYWVDDEWIWLNSIPTEELSAQLLYYKYTGMLTDTDTHPLFDVGRSALLAKTMLLLMPLARQPLWKGLYEPQFQESVGVLLNAEEDSANTDQDVRVGMLNG